MLVIPKRPNRSLEKGRAVDDKGPNKKSQPDAIDDWNMLLAEDCLTPISTAKSWSASSYSSKVSFPLPSQVLTLSSQLSPAAQGILTTDTLYQIHSPCGGD